MTYLPLILLLAAVVVVLFVMQSRKGGTQGTKSSRPSSRQERSTSTPSALMTIFEDRASGQLTPSTLVPRAEQAMQRGDFDEARMCLQKCAYHFGNDDETRSRPGFEKARQELTEIMKRFAERDPLYREVLGRVKPLVEQTPGMMQSELTKGRDSDEAERIRYVLYFAAELGDLRREKKGRSYQLFLPERGDQ